MPYLDGSIGEVMQCDRCGKIEHWNTDSKVLDIRDFWSGKLFFNRPKPDIPLTCYQCSLAINPLVYALRDIDELTLYVNRLEKVIKNEQYKKRSKDDRAIANHVS